MPYNAKSTNNNQENLINRTLSKFKNIWSPGEFPGGPVVRTRCFHCSGTGAIPGWGTKIPQATQQGQKKKKSGLQKTPLRK